MIPKGCTLIYEPRGQAGEYAELATNPYRGCGHGDAAQFGLHHPHEDYAGHLLERAEIVVWLQSLGVRVVDAPVTADVPTRPAVLAEQSLRQLPFRPGDPYRLGLNFSHRGAAKGQPSETALGWFTVLLGRAESGEA